MPTLIEHITEVCEEIGLPAPSMVMSSLDNTIKTLIRMSNREGRDQVRLNGWTELTRLHTFQTEEDEDEYDLPGDYDRLIPGTHWDRSANQFMSGPVGPQTWQVFKSGLIGSATTNRRFRIFRSATGTERKFYIDPVPDADGDTLAFEYISNAWCLGANGVTLQTEWATDTDTLLLNQDLMALGTIVRFKRAKGLAFGSEADEYDVMLRTLKGQNRPAGRLNMAGNDGEMHLIDRTNIPETGYGS